VDFKNVTAVVYLVMLTYLSIAFNDQIMDNTLIMQQRKNLKNGAEVLTSYVIFCYNTGAILGGMLSGFMISHFNPKACFLLYSFFGIIVVFLALKLSKDVDTEGNDQQFRFCRLLEKSFRDLLKIFVMPIIMKMVVFQLCLGVFNPKFTEFDFYYLSDIRKNSTVELGFLESANGIASVIGVVLYGAYLMNYEYRTLILTGVICSSLHGLIGLMWCYRVSMPFINDYQFYILYTSLFNVIKMAFVTISVNVLLSKIVPKGLRLEGTLFAFLIGFQ